MFCEKPVDLDANRIRACLKVVSAAGAPLMGAEDFSYVLHRMPGCMFFLGVRPDGADGHGHGAAHHLGDAEVEELGAGRLARGARAPRPRTGPALGPVPSAGPALDAPKV